MRYQKIAIRIWNDEKFNRLDMPAQHLFFYLLTSPHSNLIGMYVLKEGYALEDLKSSPKDYRKSLDKLIESGLISYDPENKIVLLKNYLKYNPITNKNQLSAAKRIVEEMPKSFILQELRSIVEGLNEGLTKELLEVLPEGLQKDFAKRPVTVTVTDTVTDTVIDTDRKTTSIDSISANSNSTKGNGKIPYEEIINDLNQKTGKHFRVTDDTRKLIRARWNEGFRFEDFQAVHSNMSAKWLHNPEMEQYLRPSTLYRASKFEGYLNARITLSDRGILSPKTEKGLKAIREWLTEEEAKEMQSKAPT